MHARPVKPAGRARRVWQHEIVRARLLGATSRPSACPGREAQVFSSSLQIGHTIGQVEAATGLMAPAWSR